MEIGGKQKFVPFFCGTEKMFWETKNGTKCESLFLSSTVYRWSVYLKCSIFAPIFFPAEAKTTEVLLSGKVARRSYVTNIKSQRFLDNLKHSLGRGLKIIRQFWNTSFASSVFVWIRTSRFLIIFWEVLGLLTSFMVLIAFKYLLTNIKFDVTKGFNCISFNVDFFPCNPVMDLQKTTLIFHNNILFRNETRGAREEFRMLNHPVFYHF